jgi:hypothetical protein
MAVTQFTHLLNILQQVQLVRLAILCQNTVLITSSSFADVKAIVYLWMRRMNLMIEGFMKSERKLLLLLLLYS